MPITVLNALGWSTFVVSLAVASFWLGGKARQSFLKAILYITSTILFLVAMTGIDPVLMYLMEFIP